MRQILVILMSVLFLTSFAQEKQKIALLEPRVGEGSTAVSGMEKAIVRGELRKAMVNFAGFEAITRTDIDQMMKEQNFQRTGMVSDDQIKKLGELSGADYICVSTLTKSNTEFYLEAYLIHLESGTMTNPAAQYGELSNGSLANMLPVCQALARELLGDNVLRPSSSSLIGSSGTNQQSKSVPQGYTDLGLPSGTIWKDFNTTGFCKYDENLLKFGDRLPSKAQWEELKAECQWSWTGNGYKITGSNGNSIFLPAAGFSHCTMGVSNVGSVGYYWSSTPADSKGNVWGIKFYSENVFMTFNYCDGCYGYSVRLVQY